MIMLKTGLILDMSLYNERLKALLHKSKF